MNSFKDGQDVLSSNGCLGSDKISEDQQRKSRFVECEAEIMRLSADPLLLHQYLNRSGGNDCEENLIVPLRRPPSSMGDWKNLIFWLSVLGTRNARVVIWDVMLVHFISISHALKSL
jgi:hypothetical protein